MEQPSLRPLYDSIPPDEEIEPEVITTDPEIPIDAPLYRCVYKKSKSVTRNVLQGVWRFLCSIVKPIVYFNAAICIIVLVALFVEYVLIPFGNIAYTPSANIICCIISIVAEVPWFVWVILVLVLAIPIYSLFWCLTRNLTAEDWKQTEYIAISVILGAIIGCLLSWFIGNAMNIDNCGFGLWIGRVYGFLLGFVAGRLIGLPLDSIRYYRNRIKKSSAK